MASDSKFYESLTSHLNTLNDPEYFQDEDEVFFQNDPTAITDIHNDTKLKLYQAEPYKKFLKDFMLKKHNKVPKLTNKYCEKVYRKMYEYHINNVKRYRIYEKIMYHPDVTISDYDFLISKLKSWETRIFYVEVAFFGGLLYGYYKTPLGNSMRRHPLITATVFGLFPIVSVYGLIGMNRVLFDRKVTQMGLKDKYHIK